MPSFASAKEDGASAPSPDGLPPPKSSSYGDVTSASLDGTLVTFEVRH